MARTDISTDLTKTEGDPSAHAYVDLPQEDFEFAWARSTGLKIKTRTAPGSSLSAAIIAFLLSAGGCGCTATLTAVAEPAWVAISGLLMPTAIFFGLRLTRTKK